MADQPPIRDVVLRCRDCKQEVPAREAHQECQSFQCRIGRERGNYGANHLTDQRWSGWEIAHITRAEAA